MCSFSPALNLVAVHLLSRVVPVPLTAYRAETMHTGLIKFMLQIEEGLGYISALVPLL